MNQYILRRTGGRYAATLPVVAQSQTIRAGATWWAAATRR